MPLTVTPNHSKKDLEIILKALPEPNVVVISAYPTYSESSPYVEGILNEIERHYKPHLLMYDLCRIEICVELKNPSKKAILDFYESSPAYFQKAVWYHKYDNLKSLSVLILTPTSFNLSYMNSTPAYLPALSKTVEKTKMKLDVKTEINGLKART